MVSWQELISSNACAHLLQMMKSDPKTSAAVQPDTQLTPRQIFRLFDAGTLLA